MYRSSHHYHCNQLYNGDVHCLQEVVSVRTSLDETAMELCPANSTAIFSVDNYVDILPMSEVQQCKWTLFLAYK